MPSIPIGNIQEPSHLGIDFSGAGMDLVYEVYSGFAVVDFRGFTPDSLLRRTIHTYLPTRVIDGTFRRVNVYRDDSDKRPSDITTTAAIAVAAEVGDDNLFGVDSARTILAKQPHLEDDPFLLLLSADLAVRAAVIVRISYQVTLWVEGGAKTTTQLRVSDRPARA